MKAKSQTTFDFEPTGQLFRALVTRHVTIEAPLQKVNGKHQELTVTPRPLPLRKPKPPAKKGIEKVVRMVIDPLVQIKDTGEVLNKFDPPLTITIHFTSQDADAARDPETGKPKLSIICYYRAGNKDYRWQKLKTKMSSRKPYNEGTLTATLSELLPDDPMGMGFPD
jgi:hypothetical protein